MVSVATWVVSICTGFICMPLTYVEIPRLWVATREGDAGLGSHRAPASRGRRAGGDDAVLPLPLLHGRLCDGAEIAGDVARIEIFVCPVEEFLERGNIGAGHASGEVAG